MNNKKKNIFIFLTASIFGLGFGFLFVSVVNNITPSIKNFVSNINLESKEIVKGGPDPEEIWEDKKGEDVYFLNYSKKYRISNQAPVPYLSADSYLVGDLETGEIIISRNEDRPLAIASITKLMTALVADDFVGLNTELKVSKQSVDTYGRQGNLVENEIYKISEILYPLLLESSNDAAEAIAESYGRDNFMRKMNDKSREIQMYNTHFGDPSGLSPKNISTVSDLFKLSQHIESYRNYIYEITKTRMYELENKTWFNNSKFRSDDEYYGGKNGYTDIAWKTQIAIFEINLNGELRKIVFIILKTDDIEGDIYGLKRYVERHVTYE